MCVCGIDGGNSVCSLIKVGSTASNLHNDRPDVVDWGDVRAFSVVVGDSEVSGSGEVDSEVGASVNVASLEVISVDVPVNDDSEIVGTAEVDSVDDGPVVVCTDDDEDVVNTGSVTVVVNEVVDSCEVVDSEVETGTEVMISVVEVAVSASDDVSVAELVDSTVE